MSKILIILTSHTAFGETGRGTGFYFEELAVPYYAFIDAGSKWISPRSRADRRRMIRQA